MGSLKRLPQLEPDLSGWPAGVAGVARTERAPVPTVLWETKRMSDAIEVIANHVAKTGFDKLPRSAVNAAKTFMLDSFGVGLAGSTGPMAEELVAVLTKSGAGNDARVWGSGNALPATAAAMCNAYQLHNAEFDCIHEEAVVHVMAVVLPVAMAAAEREGKVSGKSLLEAVVLGVEVAAGLGVAAKSGLTFFRPGTAGAFGAVAAMGRLAGFRTDQFVNAFSLVYGQLCGSMQAHAEGTMMLATQIAFNARNAITACDLAGAGFTGPKQILEGEYGYFRLFENGGDIGRLHDSLGKTWRIEEVAHKPYPSGRATHGIVNGCLELQHANRFEPASIESITATVPALVFQLVGRPVQASMSINYARLCAQHVTACALLRHGVSIDDFSDAAYADPERQNLARRIRLEAYEADNPNALTPIHIRIALQSGEILSHELKSVYGAPDKPMSREEHLLKFRSNCRLAARPISEAKTERLVGLVDRLEELDDVSVLVDHLVP